MKAIGIDIGTTTMSFVVMDTGKKAVVEARTVPNRSFIETNRAWERVQDVSVMIGDAKEVLDELLEKYPETVSIGLTGQMHGILYTDQEGECLSPLYTWQDQRGMLPDFEGESMVEQIKRVCGVEISAGYGLATHLYHHRKGMIPARAASICTIPDYLGMVLTGRTEPLMHSSMAASLGFFDVPKGSFRVVELEQLGLEASILPQVTDEAQVLGTYKGRSVTAALGDNQASFLGAVGLKENTPLVNVGTGGQISVLSDRYFEAPGIEARPFLGGRYLLVGASLCGGRAYAILEKFFRSYMLAAEGSAGSQYKVMEKLAAEAMRGAAGDECMEVDTSFNGSRTDPAMRGSIRNLSEDNFTPQGLVLGVLRGIARELYEMYEIIVQGTGIPSDTLVASGNGVRKNQVLQKIFQELFQAELVLAEWEEEAACGAAISSMGEG